MPSAEQERVSAILVFRAELARLEAEHIVALDPATLEAIRRHHEAELAALAARGDVDVSVEAARLSAGMRVAILLGAIALSAAYGFFVNAHWADLPLAPQLLLVSVPPAVLAALTAIAATRERSGYIASLIATVAVIAFAVDLSAVGAIYNLPGSRGFFLAVGGFALLLAYGYRLTLPLALGIVGVGLWFWSLGAVPLGLWWTDGFSVIEPLFVAGLLAIAVPHWVRGPATFATWWRALGTAAITVGLLLVGESGGLSVFTAPDVHTIEVGYRIVAAVAFAALIEWALRREQRLVANIAAAGAVLYLFERMVDVFWDWVPKEVFFLLCGIFALAIFFVLRRLRTLRVAPA